jgi:hypothetical protein
LRSAVEQQRFALHHVNGIHYNIVLCEVEAVCSFGIVLSLNGLYIGFRSDSEQTFLHLENFALSNILVGRYYLTVNVGSVHLVEVHNG